MIIKCKLKPQWDIPGTKWLMIIVISIGKDVEQIELSYSAYESGNWCSYSCKGFRQPITKAKNIIS